MLGHEDRMSAHGRLSAVVCRRGRRQSFGNEILRVLSHRVHSFFPNIIPVIAFQGKTAAEFGLAKPLEQRTAVKGRLFADHGRLRSAFVPDHPDFILIETTCRRDFLPI